MQILNYVRRLLLVMLLLCGLPLHAVETGFFAKIGSQIEQYPIVRAEFTQTKHMAALKRPLVTSGRLVFSREHGVAWKIEHPYSVTYLLSDERMVEIGADGTRKERGQREVPGLAQIGRVFHAMLGANTATLHEYFEVIAHSSAKKWSIDLKPRQPQIAKFIASLHITGDRFVESIRIVEAGGDTTTIRFRNMQGADKPSKSDELFFTGKPG